jgi:Protein of unknown function (DUF3810)
MRYALMLADLAAIFVAVDMRFFVPTPIWIERHYSNGYYPHIDAVLRSFAQPLPFSLGDALGVVFVVTLGTWLFDTTRDAFRRRRFGKIGVAALRICSVLALIFIWFMVAWGYNYGRVPAASKIIVDNSRTNEDSVAAFADRVVDELDANAEAAHAVKVPSVAEMGAGLAPTFEAAIHRLGDEASYSAPPIKPTVFQLVMTASGSDGFMDPWTHELNVDATLSPYERPAIYAHEWAHMAGFADESEANLIAVLACTNSSDPLFRYSGWLLTLFNLPSNVKITHRLSELAASDIEAIRRRYARQTNPTVARAQRTAYNAYLHANRVKAGYASYEYFIRWLTGAHFDENGLPLVRSRTKSG